MSHPPRRPSAEPSPDAAPPARSVDTRRFLLRVAAVGTVIIALALGVWARSCAEARRCATSGGRWDEEWKVCRQ